MKSQKASSYLLIVLVLSGLAASNFPPAAAIIATGGTVTYSGGYVVHTFTTSGTFTVTDGTGNVEVMVVAGGGGGASGGGAGGAGGYRTNSTYPVSVGAYTVTIGAGGAGGSAGNDGTVGGNSVFGAITSTGGGGGGSANSNGFAGGSGGGAGASASAHTGGTASAGQGNNGGANAGFAFVVGAGAGGGGAGAVGGATVSDSIAGDGGIGVSNSINGTAVFYAGGGGGGIHNGVGTAKAGGAGGGGAGCSGVACVATAGSANKGGGGGGGSGSGAGAGGNGGSGIVIVRYAVSAPDPITTLSATGTDSSSTTLSWSAPELNGGTLQNYVLNYTTPCGIPLTALPNGTTATSYSISGLTSDTCYSFRASAATQYGKNDGGNILNVTTLAFNEANYTIGSFNYNAQNPVRLPIRYERIDNGTQTMVNVTFSSTVSLACDLKYTYAMTNQTYHTIPYSTISSTEKESSFQFTNSSNDIVTFHCWDQAGNQSANYVLTQTHFLLLQQVEEFRNGTYGTMGQLGAFDFISLIVVIIAMIGFNQKNESVAGFFCIVAMGVMAYFDIVSWITFVVAAAAVIIMLIVASTRKE